MPTTKTVLRESIGDKPCQLADKSRVREARLPSWRDESLASDQISDTEAILELCLAVERGDLNP